MGSAPILGAYKQTVGAFASLDMKTNFMLELNSFESHCHPPSEVKVLLINKYQFSSWNSLFDKFFIRFSQRINVVI